MTATATVWILLRRASCVASLLALGAQAAEPPPIDRRALIARHDPVLTAADPASPLMVGNGQLALAADITGLATFPERYAPLAPLMIQAQWAWHSFPNPAGYRLEQSLVPIEVRGETHEYPWLLDWAQAKRPAIAWLRENPHRVSLGQLALHLGGVAGKRASLEDLTGTEQRLDLWTGTLSSRFSVEGDAVEVETSVHPELDLIIVRLRSQRLADGRLGVDLKLPGVSKALNPDPQDWAQPEAHQTRVAHLDARGVTLERQLDATRYGVRTSADRDVEIQALGPHHHRFTAPGGDAVTLLFLFSPEAVPGPLPSAADARAAVEAHWRRHWTRGGVVDFSGSTDPRARELERRVVLSQYLMAVNAAGALPPQEEGLFSNSWNGKFHLEMHLWHAAHFATWGRPELLERSLGWYLAHLPHARARARGHGARGAWWPKMVGPDGRESPSTITPFIMWQQPHPILLCELLFRARGDRATLERYAELVFETAELLASFPHEAGDRLSLGPPIIPAQEVFPPLSTWNPTFELEYFRVGLSLARRWRERLGLAPEPAWARVVERLAPLPQRDGLYLATESQPGLWEQARTAACAPGRAGPACLNRDHPSMLAAFGLLSGPSVDREVMRRTLQAVRERWDLRQTWGWDPPLLAMTAARLHDPEAAVDLLLADTPNFRFGRAGMTPREHVDPGAAGPSAGAAAGSRRHAQTYFPSNGALLLAVGMMAAGWDGESGPAPGFPKDGRWVVRSEGLLPLP